MIYCPTGNVATPLLSSLSQLFLEPYYRTFEGFKVLVLKEWIYYRHNFLKESQVLVTPQDLSSSMSSTSAREPSSTNVFGVANFFGTQAPKTAVEKRIKPIFIFFLEAVSQLIKMNPLAFEMNCRYTAQLASMVFTNRYFEFVQGDEFIDLGILAAKQQEESKS